VREAVVVPRDRAGETHLVAYLIPAPGQAPSTSVLRRHLRDRLPDYMIPSAFVPLDAFPLTPNGKLDRDALPDPGADRPDVEATYVSPTGELERAIAAVWQGVLGVDRVGLHDNFFDLGAHSLLIMKAHRLLRDDLGRDVPVVALFQYPTIAALAAHLGGAPAGRPDPTPQKLQDRVAQQKAARSRRGSRAK
jgi:hypothetical protein